MGDHQRYSEQEMYAAIRIPSSPLFRLSLTLELGPHRLIIASDRSVPSSSSFMHQQIETFRQ